MPIFPLLSLCLFCFLVSWLAILILLAYMAMVIVILLNILIAQLSYTYSEAKKTAKLQYAIDTMFIVTRLEYSRLARWVRISVLSQRGVGWGIAAFTRDWT